MRFSAITAISFASLLFLGAAACSKDAASPDGHFIEGVISDRGDSTKTDFAWLTVKSSATDPCGTIWRIFPYTTLRKKTASGSTTTATFDEFKLRATVHIWQTGVPTQTCPGQGTATAIELE